MMFSSPLCRTAKRKVSSQGEFGTGDMYMRPWNHKDSSGSQGARILINSGGCVLPCSHPDSPMLKLIPNLSLSLSFSHFLFHSFHALDREGFPLKLLNAVGPLHPTLASNSPNGLRLTLQSRYQEELCLLLKNRLETSSLTSEASSYIHCNPRVRNKDA